MRDAMPEAFDEFVANVHRLEEHYRDMQDIEFTVEDGKLYLLQTRAAKRTAAAALKAAAAMVDEGLISREEAVARIDPAVERAKNGPVILVRWETTPDDIHGMIAAQGILTVHGGMTSHAAVVARGMGKPCVAGCDKLSLDLDAKTASIDGRVVAEGDVITIDG